MQNLYSPGTVFTARSMMPPSYPYYISYSIIAKIEDETVFGVAKYCEPMRLYFNLCKDIWTATTDEGFQAIEFEERPEDK